MTIPQHFGERDLAEATGLPAGDALRLMFLAKRFLHIGQKSARAAEPHFSELVSRVRNGEVTLAMAPSLDEIRIHWAARHLRGGPPGDQVYFIQMGERGPIKIGVTQVMSLRLPSLQTGSPYKLRVVATLRGSVALERHLHKTFRSIRLQGEWFKPTKRLVDLVERIARHNQRDAPPPSNDLAKETG